ncbi:DUF4167 domain-containing protein [Ancylobacter mangrovi]|uniref:DUF4167 domain-containing protein n=1 Tax=Ancylobacter mangrovi TaxID=2972472 RepID=UPI0021618488|nr:DUF4167 domain-containing protein [Ancylobacter mangrovi]MCS0504106.1 DUF4167 domain-containing protein [Ancylobacter mangrovi]
MRNNNQQKRMRGRNNNRRSQNPLTRVYESNGPDVKVRGTAQTIVEKYQQLARDAQASGDPVAAENYLQHAEHYYRIIAAVQAQFGVTAQSFQRSDEDDEFDENEEAGGGDVQPAFQSREPQHQREGNQRENQRDFFRDRRDNRERGGHERNQDRRDGREDRGRDERGRDDRGRDEGGREERAAGEQRGGRWNRDNRPYREPRENNSEPYRDPGQQPQPRLGPEVESEIGLPAFITQSTGAANGAGPHGSDDSQPAARTEAAPRSEAPEPAKAEARAEPAAEVAPAPAPRRTRKTAAAAAPAPEAPAEEGEEAARAPRTRRRRYRRADGETGEATNANEPAEAGE